MDMRRILILPHSKVPIAILHDSFLSWADFGIAIVMCCKEFIKVVITHL